MSLLDLGKRVLREISLYLIHWPRDYFAFKHCCKAIDEALYNYDEVVFEKKLLPLNQWTVPIYLERFCRILNRRHRTLSIPSSHEDKLPYLHRVFRQPETGKYFLLGYETGWTVLGAPEREYDKTYICWQQPVLCHERVEGDSFRLDVAFNTRKNEYKIGLHGPLRFHTGFPVSLFDREALRIDSQIGLLKIDDPMMPNYFRWHPLSEDGLKSFLFRIGGTRVFTSTQKRKLRSAFGNFRLITRKERKRVLKAAAKKQLEQQSRKRKRID